MNNLSRRLFALTITAVIASLALAQDGGDTTTLTQLSNYRQWTKVNREPVKVTVPLKVDPALVAS
jgi:hypothetical protein